MTKRFLTSILLFVLLLAPIPSTTMIKASTPGGQKSSDAQAKVEGILREAGKSAIYDQAGRVTKLTFTVSDNKAVSLSFTYDEQSRIQYIIQEDGTKIRLEYNDGGQWQGAVFPDGGRVTLERDLMGNVIGFRTEKPASRKASQLRSAGAHNARLRKASMALVDDCKAAVDRATDAAIAAGLACAVGPSPICTAAVAWAVVTAYLAYKACHPEIMLEESEY